MTDTPEAAVEPTPQPAAVVPEQPAEPEETVTLPRAEADALRRRVAESERTTRKLEQAAKAQEEERQAEEGKWQELAQQRERELQAERDSTARVQAEARISRLAAKHKFIDPTDVIGRVGVDEAQDDAAVEAALERVAKASPHLVAKEAPARPEIGQVHPPAPPDGPKPPAGKQPLLTVEDVEALSDGEFQARYAEVMVVLNKQQ